MYYIDSYIFVMHTHVFSLTNVQDKYKYQQKPTTCPYIIYLKFDNRSIHPNIISKLTTFNLIGSTECLCCTMYVCTTQEISVCGILLICYTYIVYVVGNMEN